MSKVEGKPPGLSVIAAGAALTLTLLVGYLACWLVAASSFSSPFAHAWLEIFSIKPRGSLDQLVEGAIYSAVAAWFAALIFVPVYNLMARADRVI